jgi:predicted alpha-1,2-mannosidase
MRRGTHDSRLSRRPMLTAAAAAGMVGVGIATSLIALPAGAASSRTQVPTGPTTTTAAPAALNGPAGSDSHGPPPACTKGQNGRPVNCPAPVPSNRLPSGATNTTPITQPVTDPATLVDARTWTTGGGNTFPGAEVPFGMVQWSPDTSPSRSAGGGYTFGNSATIGYSLTHISGPGCGAAGDVPMLPMTGPLPDGNPNGVATAFSNDGEVAQAGYYSAKSNQPDTITSEFTATPHSAMGRFTYPATTQAGFLIKLRDSQNGQFAPSTAQILNGNEVSGSETSGHFCGEAVNDGQRQEYTVHFDITFNRPFSSSQIINRSDGTPNAVYLTFDTTSNAVVQAKVGISYVSDDNARLNRQTDNPGWDFGSVKSSAQDAWNTLLGRIQVSGGSFAQTQQFYSNLYKAFIQPNITSDVNGEYMGADIKVHTIGAAQHDQYGIFSGWDTFHSLSQLQAMLDPAPASDQAQSLLNYYSQDKILQQWGHLHLNNYVMVGDPAQSIIADYYAFGARDFDTTTALKDMLAQATTVNDVRPGEALEAQYGYLPEDGKYGCCNPHGFVPTLLEYNSQDLALSRFAAALGDTKDAAMLEARANNWQNVFNLSNNLLNGRNKDGSFVPGVTPTGTTRYVEGTAYEYLWNVPNDYAALFALLGGKTKVVPALREFLSQPSGFGMHAYLTNEFGFGEQYALNYAGDPAGTQQAVNNIRNTMYEPGPSGLLDNDDLGANSSAFIWEMLGMYPENSGIDNLVFNSPGFPYAAITLPTGKTITINAPGASPSQYYVSSLKINGSPYNKLYVPYSTLAAGATLDWKLTTTPTNWGAAPQAAPPSYRTGEQSVVASVDPGYVVLQPGGSATATLLAANVTDSVQKVSWTASAVAGLTVNPAQGSLSLAPSRRNSTNVSVSAAADAADGRYTVSFQLTTANGEQKTVTLGVAVAKRGELWPYYTNAGITDDADTSAATYDGGGWSYSAQALAAQGVTRGSTVTVNGIDYAWPDVPVATLDNIEAAGQTIPLGAPAHASRIGLLGSSTNAGSAGAGGTATITYTDGSTSQFTAKFSDWTLGAGGFPPLPGNTIAVSMPYRNYTGNLRDNVETHVFAMEAPVSVAKTVASITLPQATGGDMHVFAITLPPAPAHAVTLTPATQKGGGRVGAAATYTEHLTNAGYEADSYTVSSTSTWTAHVYDASCTTPLSTTATVQPGDSVDLCVKVSVPASAANADTSDTTITATSTTDSSVSAIAKLTTIAVSVDTLVVDGDMGGPNVESYYENALSANGVSYSYWDLSADPALPLSMLTAHKNVIWFTGNAYPGPITAYESELAKFLDGGGRLFMSGQDILDGSAGTTPFVHDYLHIAWDGSETQNDKPTANVHGVPANAVSAGIGSIPLDHSVLDSSYEDEVTPIAPATAAFTDDTSAPDALTVTAGAYKAVFLGFPFEAYGTTADKADLMHRVLVYLG